MQISHTDEHEFPQKKQCSLDIITYYFPLAATNIFFPRQIIIIPPLLFLALKIVPTLMKFAPLSKKKLFNIDIYSENLFIKISYLKSEIVASR